MLNHIDFLKTRLAAPLKSVDNVVRLRNTYRLLELLNALPEGDHIYLVVSYQTRTEVLRYTHGGKLSLSAGEVVLPVERGQHNTVVTSWPAGACVRSEITKHILDEWAAKNCCGADE